MKSSIYHIFKTVMQLDRHAHGGVLGMYYEFVSVFQGTDSQANKHCIQLYKKDPTNKHAIKDIYDRPDAYTRSEYTYVSDDIDGWIKELRRDGWEVRNLPEDEPRQKYEAMSKEQLIDVIINLLKSI